MPGKRNPAVRTCRRRRVRRHQSRCRPPPAPAGPLPLPAPPCRRPPLPRVAQLSLRNGAWRPVLAAALNRWRRRWRSGWVPAAQLDVLGAGCASSRTRLRDARARLAERTPPESASVERLATPRPVLPTIHAVAKARLIVSFWGVERAAGALRVLGFPQSVLVQASSPSLAVLASDHGSDLLRIMRTELSWS